MARVTTSFVSEVPWPEFCELNTTLREHLDFVTQRISRSAIHGDSTEAEERPGEAHGAARPGVPSLE